MNSRVSRPSKVYMTTDQVLLGVGLILVLAVGSQVLASLVRVPALIILLPAGFIAGALTTDVNPQRLLGVAFQPLVSLAVAVILYDAGLALNLRGLHGHPRRVVRLLILEGVPVTWAFGAVFAALLLGMSTQAALMIGAILVVSGPTVVGPLLRFVRPTERLQLVLSWEGSLIDPVGGILGAVVFHAVLAHTHRGVGYQLGFFLGSVSIGVAGAVVAVAVLWVCLRMLDLGEVLGTCVQLACVVGVAAVCDAIRDDAGLIAAVVTGLALANIRGFDIAARRPFFETLVQLIIGVLFISISATVTPASLRHLILPTLGLVAALVLLARPLVAFLATLRTDLNRGERMFTGWMAPRGIVAAATASTFGTQLTAAHVGGAAKILPVTFLVIVATVGVYSLTAVPVARHLGVTRPARARPLLVGGDPWVIDLARTLRGTGLDVIMWATSAKQREQISAAGLELAQGELLAAATVGNAELEGITHILLLTDEDDFNALAAIVLAGNAQATVYRLAPRESSHGVIAPYTGPETVFAPTLTSYDIDQRHRAGARTVTMPADGTLPPSADLLFLVGSDGSLRPATTSQQPSPRAGDTLVLLASNEPGLSSSAVTREVPRQAGTPAPEEGRPTGETATRPRSG
jgi:NhaP-type Na+/H+ or K+/H+ antiporter